MERACILVVDDSDDYHWMSSSWLHHAGYYTARATNGRTALEFLHRAPLPDLILLDLHMPDMDGAAFCHRKAADPKLRDVPILLYSNSPLLGTIAAELPVAGHLAKLEGSQQLITTIQRILGSAKSGV